MALRRCSCSLPGVSASLLMMGCSARMQQCDPHRAGIELLYYPWSAPRN
jgi:hypothetical protein